MLTLRLRGIFAAVMAWFVGIALMGVVNNMTEWTRGPLGMAPTSLLERGTGNRPYFFVILTMMVITYVTLKLITNSNYGLAFRALGQNIDAARASGINPTKYRVFNFTVSAFFAGWLGGFYAHYFGSLTPQTLMHASKTVEILAIAYIGGRGSLWGGIAIAFPFVFFIEYLRSNFTDLPGLHMVIYGILMVVVMIYYPAGFSGFYEWLKEKIKKILQKQPQ
jgi:branched-chain amino acid transport system permease protein